MTTFDDLPIELVTEILKKAGPTRESNKSFQVGVVWNPNKNPTWNFAGFVCRQWYKAIKPRKSDCNTFIRMMRSTCHPHFIFEMMLKSGSHPLVVSKLMKDFRSINNMKMTDFLYMDKEKCLVDNVLNSYFQMKRNQSPTIYHANICTRAINVLLESNVLARSKFDQLNAKLNAHN